MNIADIFIRRPVMTTLIMIAILLFGIMGYRYLPVSDLPNVDFPTIQVGASLPGASPETMAAAVATPLERQFSTIAGIDSMTSSSSFGSTSITLQFNLERDIDAAAQDVQTAIAAASRQLPQDMPAPPSYRKVNPADQPIMYLALLSQTMPLSSLNEYAETIVSQRISTVPGVAQVQVYGSQKYAVRIQVDPRALASRKIGIDEVAEAVQRGNANLPTGTLFGPNQAYTVQAPGQLYNAAAYRPLIVAYRNGSPVRLDEIARVADSVENDKTAAWFVRPQRQERSLILAIQKQPGTNTVAIADNIRRLLPVFKQQMPASVGLEILNDRSESIRESVHDVKFTLYLTLCLVVMVIFLFLRNLSATVIPSLALPMSIIGTFALMYMFGYSLDNLSLMALTLAVGFVVDDAIVMLENIVRHREMGKGMMEAAFEGSREVGFTIVSMTLSLAAVFIPFLFMGGIVGRLFHEFAVTIGVAVLISGFVSLTLTPMLCSLFLRPAKESEHGRFYRATERMFDRSLSIYERSLRWVLDHRRATMVASAVMLALTAYLFVKIPKGFLPSSDTNQIFGITEAAEGISYQSMIAHQKAVASIIQKDPNVVQFMSSAGGRGGITSSNSGVVFIRLKPRDERDLTVDQVIEQLRRKLSAVPGMRVFLQNPPPIRIGGGLSKGLYQFTLQSPNINELYQYGPMLEEKMRDLPGLQDVSSDVQLKNPEINVQIDRDKAATLDVSVRQLQEALYYAYGSRQISTIYGATSDYDVIMEVLPEYQRDPAALGMLYVRSTKGELIPLNTLARLEPALGPLSVNHAGQLPSVSISFNLKPGFALGDAVAQIERLSAVTLPDTISTMFQGQAQAFQSSMQSLGLLLLVSILVIYLVLGILYESFVHPLTILTALPFAGLGALLTLMVFGKDLSIYGFVGVIMLIGLVKKNGIMMIDFALEAQRNENKNAHDAIVEACLVRFRPIMMTTLAALLGTLPIAVGYGAGAEARQPLGLAVVGGLLFSQLLTLYVTPVFYTYMDTFQRKSSSAFAWMRRRRGRKEATAETQPAIYFRGD